MKRFNQILVSYCSVIVIGLLAAVIVQCSRNEDKYVYEDVMNCIHVDKECKGFSAPPGYPTDGARRVLKKEFKEYRGEYCRFCVSDKDYEELHEISEMNSKSQPY